MSSAALSVERSKRSFTRQASSSPQNLADASEVNERNSMLIETADGHDVAVVQIAGLLARRIVCYAGVGDVLPIGDTYGLIRFGSRVDTYFPAGTTLLVEPGQRTIGAETVIAQLP